MTVTFLGADLVAQAPGTGGLQGWIQDNIVPLILLGIAIIMLWIGGRGDNAGQLDRCWAVVHGGRDNH